jgi:hypothetical protein
MMAAFSFYVDFGMHTRCRSGLRASLGVLLFLLYAGNIWVTESLNSGAALQICYQKRMFIAGTLIAGLCACGLSVDSAIDDLEAGGSAGSQAAQELLLLKSDDAVGPLLTALGDPTRPRVHMPAIDVLVGLLDKVEDERLQPGLEQHLQTHPNAEIRAGIASRLGLRRQGQFASNLLVTLQDSTIEVRYAAFRALIMLWSKLETEQREQVDARARAWATTTHEGLREEVEARLESQAETLIRAANQAVVEARLDVAEEKFVAAITLLPDSWKTRFSIARFYLDNGKPQLGYQQLDELGAVLRVSHSKSAPILDGHLDEAFWKAAAQIQLDVRGYRGFFDEAELETRAYISYADDALYVGMYNGDPAPGGIIASKTTRDDEVWLEDSVELFFDSNGDRHSYLQIIVSGAGTIFDAVRMGRNSQDRDWNGDFQTATHVGDDFWSLEARLAYDDRWLKRPHPGDHWVANFCRNFRDPAQSSQWVYTGGDFHRIADFGFIEFR